MKADALFLNSKFQLCNCISSDLCTWASLVSCHMCQTRRHFCIAISVWLRFFLSFHLIMKLLIFWWGEKDQTQPIFQVSLWVFTNMIASPKTGKPCGGCVQNSLLVQHDGQMHCVRDWLDFKSCSYALHCSNWYTEEMHRAAHASVQTIVLWLFAPKHSNQGLKECFLICFCDTDMSHRKQDVCHGTFCHRDSPAFPCSLVDCWLCSCFPSRSGAPDDGRPRYGLCSFSTLLSVSSCFVAAFTPSPQRMAHACKLPGCKLNTYFCSHFFFHVLISLYVGLILGLLLWLFSFLFILCTVILENKWDVRTCDWTFPYIYQHMQL